MNIGSMESIHPHRNESGDSSVISLSGWTKGIIDVCQRSRPSPSCESDICSSCNLTISSNHTRALHAGKRDMGDMVDKQQIV